MKWQMKAAQADQWARERTQGRLRFVAVKGVLVWSGLFLVLWATSMWLTVSENYFAEVFLTRPISLLAAVIGCGGLLGWCIWEYNEFRYRRTPRQ